jgi:type IV pilus assembly protein PilC
MREKKMDASHISAFCMELYLIIRAGLPFSEGILLMRDEEDDQQYRTILTNLYRQLELGEPIAAAMRAADGFPVYVIKMVEIGQRTGHLENVFHALASYYERMEQLQKSLRNAVIYPAVLLVMMLFVVLVLLIKVLPIFQGVFQQLGAELSPVAKGLLMVGEWLGYYGLIGLLVLAVLVLVGAVLLRNQERRDAAISWLQRKTEGWKIRRLIASSRLADALAMTLASGMDIDDSLDMVTRLLPGDTMQAQIAQCKREMLLENKSFADASASSGLFTPFYCRMIAVGFRTGNIDVAMEEVARRSAEQVDDAIEAALNRVEPTLVIIMSVMVGLILLSVMLPLMSVLSAMG